MVFTHFEVCLLGLCLTQDNPSSPEGYDIRGSVLDVRLVAAAGASNLSAFRSFLDRGANISYRGPGGQSVLHQACAHKSGGEATIELVRFVLDYEPEDSTAARAHLGAMNHNGHTLLHECCVSDRVDVARLLIERGIDLDMPSVSLRTPLMLAVHLGREDMVKLLVESGADLMEPTTGPGSTKVLTVLEGAASKVGSVMPNKKKDEAMARGVLALMDAIGMTPMDKVGGKSLFSFFFDPRAKAVIRDAQRRYRSKLMGDRLEDAMGCDLDDSLSPARSRSHDAVL